LQAASIIGRQFHRQILYSVLQPGGSVEVDEQVKKICARGFFVEPVESDIPILEFRHNLTAEIVSTTIEESDRARLHGRVGRALEVYYAGQLSTQVDLLAHHFGRSDQEGPALHYCALAGQRAARRYLNEQARQYFETALSLLSRLPHGSLQAVEIFMGLGDVLLLIGEYQQARLKFESALQALMGESKTSVLGHTCTLHRKIGNTCERQGDFEQALQYLKKARKMVEDPARPFPAEESQVLSDLGWIHFRLGNFKEAETNLIHALSLAQQARRYDVTASIYNRLGGIYWQKDDLEKATNFVQKSIALREEIGDMVAVARSYNNLGLLDWKRGKWDSALECFNRSLSMHANFGDIEGIIDVHGNLGLLQLDRGSIVEARTHMEESLAKARQIGHNYIVAMTLMYFSRLHIVLENWKTALDYAQQSWQAFEGMGARDELIDVFTLLGQAHLGLEDLSQAKSWADKTFELLPKDQDGMLLLRTDDTGRALRMMGEVQRRLNYFDQAERWLNASMEVFNRLGNKLEQARTMASQAALAADRGDMASSRVLLNEARLMLRALGANLDLQHLDRISGQVSLAALQ
jgi:tetratricopeptide (TPR) repeat protein